MTEVLKEISEKIKNMTPEEFKESLIKTGIITEDGKLTEQYKMDNELDVLVGQVVTKIDHGDYYVLFTLENGDKYELHHNQSCCEDVHLEDIIGNLDDLVGSPILKAEVVTSDTNPSDIDMSERFQDCFMWTFYHFATIKGYVTLRWYGDSNGYYSVEVSFDKVS